MLVLSRKLEETIHIGPDIAIKIVGLGRDRVRIGIEAPREVPILRGEFIDQLPCQPPVEVTDAA